MEAKPNKYPLRLFRDVFPELKSKETSDWLCTKDGKYVIFRHYDIHSDRSCWIVKTGPKHPHPLKLSAIVKDEASSTKAIESGIKMIQDKRSERKHQLAGK